jgi:serine/threonine-protein kinase
MALFSKTNLGRYVIRSQIGSGAMGEVYLAQDTQLERTVALKVLPAEMARDQQWMRRFKQEARAASALNHPNILTIHEVGEFEGAHYIATEYVDGETLHQHMTRSRMKLSEVLDVAIQVASALSAAHTAGIIHRDIKPENIMFRRDALVKVLDFGLAKLTEHSMSQLGSSGEAQAVTMVETEPGLVMGTIKYMSPEQARGLSVDARTDIWSLGVVLYEMVTGHVPFGGDTTSDVIASILKMEPTLLSSSAREAPAELQRIVSKALEKDQEERYQGIKDLLVDLQRLKKRLDFEAELERSTSPEMTSGATAAISNSHSATVMTPFSRTNEVGATHPTTSAEYLVSEVKRHKVGALIAFLTLALTMAAAYFFYPRSTAVIDSIAVLPFTNVSHDANTEYLSDGVTESIISSLSRLPQLKVMARSTVFHYKDREADPQQIGRELNVHAILTGRVLQQADNLIIRTELVKVADGTQLWGAEYSRKLSDVIIIQQDIAREISDKLRLRLTGVEQQQLAKRYTDSTEAYQFYLKGRYYWNKRTSDGLKKAIEQFQQAIGKDPNYALAYVGVADCHLLLEEYAGTPASETLPKAKAAALRALQIDDSLAEAHASLAMINQDSWQWEEAETEFKRAIELNPNYPTAHHWYSFYLRVVGRLDESMAEIKRAQELDPLSPIIGENVAVTYLKKGELESAIKQCKKIIELDPNFPQVHMTLGFVYQKQGHYPEALAEFQKAVELSGGGGEKLAALGHCYALSGKRSEALAIVKELEEKYTKQESTASYVAWVYAGLGERDQAFAWLEKDYQAHSGTLPYLITIFPDLDVLRSDARYADLLRRMGLQP